MRRRATAPSRSDDPEGLPGPSEEVWLAFVDGRATADDVDVARRAEAFARRDAAKAAVRDLRALWPGLDPDALIAVGRASKALTDEERRSLTTVPEWLVRELSFAGPRGPYPRVGRSKAFRAAEGRLRSAVPWDVDRLARDFDAHLRTTRRTMGRGATPEDVVRALHPVALNVAVAGSGPAGLPRRRRWAFPEA